MLLSDRRVHRLKLTLLLSDNLLLLFLHLLLWLGLTFVVSNHVREVGVVVLRLHGYGSYDGDLVIFLVIFKSTATVALRVVTLDNCEHLLPLAPHYGRVLRPLTLVTLVVFFLEHVIAEFDCLGPTLARFLLVSVIEDLKDFHVLRCTVLVALVELSPAVAILPIKVLLHVLVRGADLVSEHAYRALTTTTSTTTLGC